MEKRKGLSKKTRFEVFKRDAFTCKYCGAKPPQVILHVDHIVPVAKGGTNDFLNLVAACVDCNSGKSDRELSDLTVIEQQHEQLASLQERREQHMMMLEWKRELLHQDEEVLDELCEFWKQFTGGYTWSDNGQQTIKQLLRKYSIAEIVDAMQGVTDKFLEFDKGQATHESVELAHSKIGGFCFSTRRRLENPDEDRLYWIRGILNKRLTYCDQRLSIQLLREAKEAGYRLDDLEGWAKEAGSWTEWREVMEHWLD